MPTEKTALTSNADPQGIKLGNETQKQQVTPGQRVSDATRNTTKKQNARESQKKVHGKREGETDKEYNQRRRQQAKERSRRGLNQSF